MDILRIKEIFQTILQPAAVNKNFFLQSEIVLAVLFNHTLGLKGSLERSNLTVTPPDCSYEK